MINGGEGVFLCNAGRSRQLSTSSTLSSKAPLSKDSVLADSPVEFEYLRDIRIILIIRTLRYPRAGGVPSATSRT